MLSTSAFAVGVYVTCDVPQATHTLTFLSFWVLVPSDRSMGYCLVELPGMRKWIVAVGTIVTGCAGPGVLDEEKAWNNTTFLGEACDLVWFGFMLFNDTWSQ